MLRPSLIIWRMAGTPSAVAGIFTMRLRSGDRLVQVAGGGDRAVGVVGEIGATSTLTKPSPPFDARRAARSTSSAPLMSCSTIAQ